MIGQNDQPDKPLLTMLRRQDNGLDQSTSFLLVLGQTKPRQWPQANSAYINNSAVLFPSQEKIMEVCHHVNISPPEKKKK